MEREREIAEAATLMDSLVAAYAALAQELWCFLRRCRPSGA